MTNHTVSDLVAELEARMVAMEPITGSVLLDLGEARILIGGRTVRTVTDSAEADCRVQLGQKELRQILAGERDAFEAFLSGDIATEGDMSVAVQLQPLLSHDRFS